MRKIHLVLAALLCCSMGFGGTLIYKVGKEEKRVSKLKILSIDNKKFIVRVNEGTKTLPLSCIIKYYDTDINGGEFDDNSADYTIRLGEGKIATDKKKSSTKMFTIPYDVTRKSGQSSTAPMRQPYFYLFVLTTSEASGRDMTFYAYPNSARTSLKNYDEAKMLEKVISLKRPVFHESDTTRLGHRTKHTQIGGNKTATFTLGNLKDRTILAWYIVAWSKNSIAITKEHREDTSYSIPKTWWIR